MADPQPVVVDGSPLSVADVVAVARDGAQVLVGPGVAERMERSRAVVEGIVAGGATVYGITTGFGALASVRVSPAEARRLQHALVVSHAAGMGPPVEAEVVRAMMLLRARSLAAGASGVRPVLVHGLVALLRAWVTPVVPELGSLGASGDLAPLAHVGAVLVGEGSAAGRDGTVADGAEALAAAGLEPIVLEAKEGLSLLNGTEGMLAHLCLALADLELLAKTADLACAMTVEALLGTDAAYAPELHALRPHPGQATSAANLRRLLAGSAIMAGHRLPPGSESMPSHRAADHAVQDAYSLRCAPQVHGATRDVIAHARQVADRELASVTDNPVVLLGPGTGPGAGRVVSTGNFHGQPLAFAADFCAIALADLAAISERRTDRMMDPARSDGLPAFLAVEAGINSGFMLAHYTAAAAVNRLRTWAAPASIDTISTSGGQEDHVSMGWNACRKLRSSLADAARVLTVEILCAAQALELRQLRPSPETEAAVARLRAEVPPLPADRFLAPDLAATERLVWSGALLPAWIG